MAGNAILSAASYLASGASTVAASDSLLGAIAAKAAVFEPVAIGVANSMIGDHEGEVHELHDIMETPQKRPRSNQPHQTPYRKIKRTRRHVDTDTGPPPADPFTDVYSNGTSTPAMLSTGLTVNTQHLKETMQLTTDSDGVGLFELDLSLAKARPVQSSVEPPPQHL
jgi:hypothetical protein